MRARQGTEFCIISAMEPSRKGSSSAGGGRRAVKIWLTVLGLLITEIGVWVNYEQNQKSVGRFPILVLANDGGGAPVEDAEVNLGIPEISPAHTDKYGQVSFSLDKNIVGREGSHFSPTK